MTQTQDVAVTYVGTDDPFKDRIYRSGLTFTPGQTRLLPAPLAARFLRHEDVFKQGQAKPAKVPEQAAPTEPTDPTQPTDDTQAQLEAAQAVVDTQRQQEEARFALLDSIDAMDRAAITAWAQDHYGQKIPGNLGVAKAREMAKGFIDQYGMPA